MQILPNGKSQFIDSAGQPLSSGSVGFYFPGTLNPKPTYQDSAGAIANPNPVPLDSRGQAVIWGSGVYRQILKDASGVTIWDQITEDANAGLTGNITDAKFVAGVDFTPGTTTQLTLPVSPGSVANMWAFFDGTYQADDQYTVNGTTLTFNQSIPVGVQEVNVKIGTTVAVGTPGAATITDAMVASGTKLYNRIHDIVDVKDYGAIGNGTTDDSSSIQAAINFVSSQGGGEVYFPEGTYAIGTVLTVPQSVILRGVGVASSIVPLKTMTNLVTLNGSLYTGIIGLGLNNVSSFATNGIVINNNSQFARVVGCYITNFSTGAAIYGDAGANAWRVLDNTFIGNLYCVFSNDSGLNSIIANNHMQSGTGIWLQKQTTQPEGVRIIGNIILPSTITGQTNSGHGIVLASSCLEISILSNIIDQVTQYAVFLPSPAAGGLQQAVKVSDCWMTGISGVKIVSNACRDFHMTNCTITGCSNVGFDAGNSGAVQLFLTNNHFYSNANFDYNLGGVIQSNFISNKFNSSAMGFEDSACSIVWQNNDFSATPGSISALSKYRYNTGYITSNSGTATWPSGSTNFTVNHGCSITPGGENIALTPIGNLGGSPYITSITSSQITWTLASAPVANTAIGWKVSPAA